MDYPILLCGFLDIEFDARMLKLSKPSEKLGDAKGMKEIKRDNIEKYRYLMKPSILEKVEAIAASELKSYGYYIDYLGKDKRVNKPQMFFYRSLDGINMIKFGMKERSFLNTERWNIKFL